MTMRAIVVITISCLSVAISAADDGDSRFAHLPQFPVLKAKIYSKVGARGYLVDTDARGSIVRTTDAIDYQIRNIKYSKGTNLANVILVDKHFTIVIKQEWRYEKNDWVFRRIEE